MNTYVRVGDMFYFSSFFLPKAVFVICIIFKSTSNSCIDYSYFSSDFDEIECTVFKKV